MILKRAALSLAALAALAAAAPVANAQDGLFVPVLSYRTGPYAPSGIPFADGFIDYFSLVNERDGGVGGVKMTWEECETAYATDRGVECYDRLKEKNGGAIVVSPWSTGTTYALIEKALGDKIPLLTLGYGRTSAADGRVFPYVFNFPATYWSQATAMVQYIANDMGGLDQLKGKRLALVHLDAPAGKEAIPTLDILAEKYGFTYDRYPVAPASLAEQKSIWLQFRRNKPDYILLFGWGVMNPTAIKEASAIRYPMDQILGWWWSGSEGDMTAAAQEAKGYKSANFHGAGTGYKVFEDLNKLHADGKAPGAKEQMGTVLYNRGLVNAAYIVEAAKLAQEHSGKKQITGEDMRWALENLEMTPEKIEALGLTGLMPPTEVTCENHEGQAPAILVQQWDGEQFKTITDWIPAMTDVVRPLVEQEAAQYAKEKGITPVACTS